GRLEAAVAEIIVLILGLHRPARREHVFGAAADGPAIGVFIAEQEGDRSAAQGQRLAIVRIGVAALYIHQCRTEGIADTGSDGAEPALVVAVNVAAGKHGAAVVLAEQAVLSFGAHHPVAVELPVGTHLYAAEEARVIVGDRKSVEIVVGAEDAAEMGA